MDCMAKSFFEVSWEEFVFKGSFYPIRCERGRKYNTKCHIYISQVKKILDF